mmetsp:Transcript_58198/g.70064  ORF Transcript_58198/g.70064 Transcript_58198/m.70064 type:complete len:631 (+) Transcript_58198:236-2128(+)
MLMVTRAMSLIVLWCTSLIPTTTVAFHLCVTNKGGTSPRTFLPPFASKPIRHYYATETTSDEENTETLAVPFYAVVKPEFESALPETDPVPESSTVLESNSVPLESDPVPEFIPTPPKVNPTLAESISLPEMVIGEEQMEMLRTIFDELVTDPIEENVPPTTLRGSLIFSSILTVYVTGLNVPLLAASALASSYLSVRPGKVGSNYRKIGAGTWNFGAEMAERWAEVRGTKKVKDLTKLLITKASEAAMEERDFTDDMKALLNEAAGVKRLLEETTATYKTEVKAIIKDDEPAISLQKVADTAHESDNSEVKQPVAVRRSYGLTKTRPVITEASGSNNSKIQKQPIAVRRSYGLTKTRSVEGEATKISLEATNMAEADMIIENDDVLEASNTAKEMGAVVAEKVEEIINAPHKVVESDINTAGEEEELFDAQDVEAVAVGVKAGIATADDEEDMFNAQEVEMVAEEIEEGIITAEVEYISNTQEVEAVAEETETERVVAEKKEEARKENEIEEYLAAVRLAKNLQNSEEDSVSGDDSGHDIDQSVSKNTDLSLTSEAHDGELPNNDVAGPVSEAVEEYATSLSIDTVEQEGQDWSKMTVVQLKVVLRSRGLKVSGKKAVLIERLKEKEFS